MFNAVQRRVLPLEIQDAAVPNQPAQANRGISGRTIATVAAVMSIAAGFGILGSGVTRNKKAVGLVSGLKVANPEKCSKNDLSELRIFASLTSQTEELQNRIQKEAIRKVNENKTSSDCYTEIAQNKTAIRSIIESTQETIAQTTFDCSVNISHANPYPKSDSKKEIGIGNLYDADFYIPPEFNETQECQYRADAGKFPEFLADIRGLSGIMDNNLSDDLCRSVDDEWQWAVERMRADLC